MNRRQLLAGLAALPSLSVLPSMTSLLAPSTASARQRGGRSSGGTPFALALYEQLAREVNPTLSPFSIRVALAMTWLGARGRTADEMQRVLGLNGSREEVGAAFAQSLARTRESGDFNLALANRLFGDDGLRFESEFLRQSKDHFGAPLEALAFRSDPDGGRRHINQWVAKQTRDNIRGLLKPGDINSLTRLVLVNAIWFQAKWTTAFDPARTADAAFIKADGSRVTTPMMRRVSRVQAGDVPGGQVAILPYGRDGRTRMMVVLPNSDRAMKDLRRITPEQLAGWRERVPTQRTDLQLPRFRASARFELKPTLSALGMPTAFGAKADFTGMARADLQIGAVIHQSVVAVDEVGTEAAAATAVVINRKGAPRCYGFRADRPFFYAIDDTRTGEILFMGRVDDPTS